MPASENGQQPSIVSARRTSGIIDFIRSRNEEARRAMTREDFDRYVESIRTFTPRPMFRQGTPSQHFNVRPLIDRVLEAHNVPEQEFPQEYPQTATEAMLNEGDRVVLNVESDYLRPGDVVNIPVDVGDALYRLEDDRTALMDFASNLRVQPGTSWNAVRLQGQDEIFDPENDFWPSDCKAICDKPKTRDGIEAFYRHHPEMRGVI